MSKEKTKVVETKETKMEEKYSELKAAIKSQGELHETLMEDDTIQQEAVQKTFDNVLKGTKQLAEIELREKEMADRKEEAKKDRKHRTIIETIKVGCEIATTAAVMIFTASENKKSRIFETSADYMSTVSKSTNKLVQSIGEGLKNLVKIGKH